MPKLIDYPVFEQKSYVRAEEVTPVAMPIETPIEVPIEAPVE